MKRSFVLVLAVAVLAAGCKDDDSGGVTVKEGGVKKKSGGEDLWTKACDHSIELMKKSDAMKDVPKEQLDKVLEGALKMCVDEFKDVGGDEADDAARCVLELTKFDPKKFSECEPKKRDRKKEEEK